ncbi:tRNA:m(4)X modification enzyme TRM13 homolog [Anopheles nili]|uniref:tRNA:m(4)X modification enzyme TRM13 homolog n=1 Tax=Anopheles nili TaxID=185578 RepID=UPI00237A5249|nr:tRNA:m(4)X modification enzyme TRM13 homolog [Anopheles nili]
MGDLAESEPDRKKIKHQLDEDSLRCKHFVQRKKRFCKMTVGVGKEFCGEHEPTNTLISSDRIVCPLDPKHTISASKLQKHLKICNARPPTQQKAYIVPGINCASSGDEQASPPLTMAAGKKLSEIPVETMAALIAKINTIYDSASPAIKEHSPRHDILEQELTREHYGPQTLKHLTQSSALLGLLDHHGFLQNDTAFIEFGAGKGQVSYWLAKIVVDTQLSHCKVLLVDRASHRHKKDNKIEDREIVQRIRADIADLVLSEIVGSNKQCVGIGKHLCGSATDLALRCLVKSKSANSTFTVKGCLFALCCHHRCEWNTFVGKQFLLANGIGQPEFENIVRMVSWAVCGTGRSRNKKESPDLENEKQDRCGLSRNEREVIGKKCKRILDIARSKYMQQNGYEVYLRYYVTSEITLENVCLVCVEK